MIDDTLSEPGITGDLSSCRYMWVIELNISYDSITWVCKSSPVTIFPTVRRAGINTDGDGWLVQWKSKVQYFKHKKRMKNDCGSELLYAKVETAYSSSSTRRGHTPASITAWILSFVPSERYDRAQQASVKTSSSVEWIRCARAGSAGLTYWNIESTSPTASEDKKTI